MGEMIVSVSRAATIDEWIEQGRSIAAMQRTIGFMIGDWANHGRQHHAEQFDMVLEQVGISPKAARKCAAIAAEFPPHLRAAGLSFDHHATVIALPPQDRAELLRRAEHEHLTPSDLREAVVQRRYENGSLFDDADIDGHMLTCIVRAWNRASTTARRSFQQLADAAGIAAINEDIANG